MNAGSRRSTSAEIVPDLLDAVERLCATRSPSDIGMRDIAHAAGHSVGAAYRYFDTKNDLIGAAMDRIGERLARAVTSSDDLTVAMESLLEGFEVNPAFVNIGSWMILRGENVSEVMSKHPAARDLIAQATSQGVRDPETFAGVVLLIGLGGAFFGSSVNRALSRPDIDRRVHGAAARALAQWAAGEARADPQPCDREVSLRADL